MAGGAAAEDELRRRRLQRRDDQHALDRLLDGARAVPGPLRLPRWEEKEERGGGCGGLLATLELWGPPSSLSLAPALPPQRT